MVEDTPEKLVEQAVKGMLPKNTVGRAQLRKLKVYAGPEHPHVAQNPAAARAVLGRHAMPTKIYTGRRKTSVARVRVTRGSGKFTLNGRPLVDYFPTDRLQATVIEPFKVTETEGQFDVIARIHGGGVSGQAGALRHGIARALEGEDPEWPRTASAPAC